jgi:hypothetical protein
MTESLPPNELPQCRRPTSHYWIVLGLLVVVYAALGTYVKAGGSRTQSDEIALPMVGLSFSQSFLFAIWAALAPQRFYHRFLWSFLLCSLVSFAEELGSLSDTRSGLGRGMVFEITVFIAATVILLLFRRLSGWQMKQPKAADVPADYQASQFGIKHLIILTTITALACGLFKTLLMMSSDVKWLPSVPMMVMFFVLLVPILVIPWYTLTYRGKAVPLLLATIVMVGVCDLAAYLMMTAIIPVTGGYWAKSLLLIQVGAGLSVFFTTLVLRWCGFRMIRQAKAQPRPLTSTIAAPDADDSNRVR